MSLRIVPKREDLAFICNELGFTKALEVGTHQGCFADLFLTRFKGHLTCLDPWEDQPSIGEFQPVFVPNTGDRCLDRDIATLVLTRKHGDRVTLVKGTLDTFVSESNVFDFIYVDGLHTSSNVICDLVMANSLLKPNGILAGHDYEPTDPTLCGVVAAVNWFIIENGFDLYLTSDDSPVSWYARRPLK